jgi:hypothetical protein
MTSRVDVAYTILSSHVLDPELDIQGLERIKPEIWGNQIDQGFFAMP